MTQDHLEIHIFDSHPPLLLLLLPSQLFTSHPELVFLVNLTVEGSELFAYETCIVWEHSLDNLGFQDLAALNRFIKLRF